MAALLLKAPEADACSCIGPRVQAWPAEGTVAPTNAHIFVRFPGGKKEKVILRLAGSGDTDGIPAARVDVTSMSVRYVELAPSVKLATGAKLEVVVGSGKRERVVSTFEVGDKAESTVPKAPAVKKTTYIYEEAVCCMCNSGEPHVSIELAGKHEGEDSALYGIWTANAKGKVDWKRKPDAYVLSWYGRLTLGDSSTCSANNYPVPKSGEVTLGLRAISWAGEQSKGKIVSVKATKKKEARPFFVPKASD
jgi:hypothetical protein